MDAQEAAELTALARQVNETFADLAAGLARELRELAEAAPPLEERVAIMADLQGRTVALVGMIAEGVGANSRAIAELRQDPAAKDVRRR